MKLLLSAILTLMFVLSIEGSPVSIPAIYLGPRISRQNGRIPSTMHWRLQQMQHPIILHRKKTKFNRSRLRQVQAVSPVRISRRYRPKMSVLHALPRATNSEIRITKNYHLPAEIAQVTKPQHFWHSRKRNRKHLLNALRNVKRRGCFVKEQQPQVYTILNAALDSLGNYTVVDINYGKVFLYKRCGWKSCTAHRYEVKTEFIIAPSAGCERKKFCACVEQKYMSNVTCRANGTLFYPANKISNLTLQCDKTKTKSENLANSNQQISSTLNLDRARNRNVADTPVIMTSAITRNQDQTEHVTGATDEEFEDYLIEHLLQASGVASER